MPDMARRIDAIPVVANSTERDLLFPNPPDRQRVRNLDTDTLERWDGSDWVSDVTLPGDGRTVASLSKMLDNNAVFNVKDYGAKGDGTTDDTEAIQAALDAADDAGGGFVRVPVGTYRLSDYLRLYENCQIRGEGMGRTILKAHGDLPSGTALIRSTYELARVNTGTGYFERYFKTGVGVFDCTLDGGTTADPSAVSWTDGENGVHLTYCDGAVVENVECKNFANDGVILEWCQHSRVDGVYVHDVNKAAIYISGCDVIRVVNCVVHDALLSVGLAASWYSTVIGCTSFSTVDGMVPARDSQHCAIVGNTVDGILVSSEESLIPSGAPSPYPFTDDRIGHGTYDGTTKNGISNCLIANNVITRNDASLNHEPGIGLFNSFHNTIAGNRLTNIDNYGIRLAGSSNNVVRDNVIRNCGKDADTTAVQAIHIGTDSVRDADDNDILDNIIVEDDSSNVMKGIRTLSSSHRTRAVGNRVTVNTAGDSYVFDAPSSGYALANYKSVTGAYTLTTRDEVVEVDASGGTVAITLPAASAAFGHTFVIRKVDSSSNLVGVSAASGNIDGGSVSMRAQWDTLVVRSDRSGYNVLAHSRTNQLTYIGSKTFDPSSLADGDGETTTVTVTGAALGDRATATFSLDTSGITITAWVSAANTVSVRLQNESGGVLDIGEGTLKAIVEKF